MNKELIDLFYKGEVVLKTEGTKDFTNLSIILFEAAKDGFLLPGVLPYYFFKEEVLYGSDNIEELPHKYIQPIKRFLKETEFKEELIKDLALGKIAVDNRVLKRDLSTLLKSAFPYSNLSLKSNPRFYFKGSGGNWSYSNHKKLPSKTINQFKKMNNIEKEFEKGSDEVKDVLTRLFPKETEILNKTRGLISCEDLKRNYNIEERRDGEYAGKGYFLSEDINWSIVKDSKRQLVLLAKEK